MMTACSAASAPRASSAPCHSVCPSLSLSFAARFPGSATGSIQPWGWVNAGIGFLRRQQRWPSVRDRIPAPRARQLRAAADVDFGHRTRRLWHHVGVAGLLASLVRPSASQRWLLRASPVASAGWGSASIARHPGLAALRAPADQEWQRPRRRSATAGADLADGCGDLFAAAPFHCTRSSRAVTIRGGSAGCPGSGQCDGCASRHLSDPLASKPPDTYVSETKMNFDQNYNGGRTNWAKPRNQACLCQRLASNASFSAFRSMAGFRWSDAQQEPCSPGRSNM